MASEPISCGKCGDIMEKRDIVSIYHKKTSEGNKMLYLCRKCCYTEYDTHNRFNKYQAGDYYAYQDTIGLKWFTKYMEQPNLRKTFKTFKELKSFAETYGYGISHIPAMIEHKQTLERELKKTAKEME